MAKKNEVVKKTKTTKRAAASGEKPVVKPRQTKPAATRKPTAAPKPPAKPRTRTTASNQPQKEDKNFVVYGTVTYADGSPAEGATVIAYDHDDSGMDILGQDTVKVGHFEIPYREADFRKTKKERGGADVIVCVYNDKQELLFTSKKKNNAPAEFELKITVPAEQFVVRGTVTHADKSFADGFLVRAFDCGLRNNEQLGDDITRQGRYEICYKRRDFTRAEKKIADLVVQVYAADGKEELASSGIIFNAPVEHVVDLQLPETTSNVSVSERITQELLPFLANQGKEGLPLPPWELNEKNIDYIVNKSGLDRENLRLWVLADKFAHEYALIEPQPPRAKRPETNTTDAGSNPTSEEFGVLLERICFFGWFLNGQPQNFDLLVRRPTADLLATLDRAVAQNHIPSLDDKLKALVSRALESRRVAEEIKPSAEGEPASLGGALKTMPLSEKLKLDDAQGLGAQVVSLLLKDTAQGGAQWQQIRDLVNDGALFNSVCRTIGLKQLTGGHIPLIQALQLNEVNETAASLADLVKHDRQHWIELAKKHGTPKEFEAETEELRAMKFGQQIAQSIEMMHPVPFINHRVLSGQIPVAAELKKPLAEFLTANPGMRIKDCSVLLLLESGKVNTGSLSEEQIKKVTPELLKMDRIARLVPSLEYIGPMLKQSLESARDIVFRYSREVFVSEARDFIANETEAGQIYDAAAGVVATTEALVLAYSPRFGGVSLPVMPSTAHAAAQATQGNMAHRSLAQPLALSANLQRLFGSQDYCECAHGASLYGPAAYLADLLHTLARGPRINDKSALDILLARRPDLAEIDLTGDNTDITMPYIDLVLEILEVPDWEAGLGVRINRNSSIDSSLDSGVLPQPLALDIASRGFTLSEELTIGRGGQVTNSGGASFSSWLIRDRQSGLKLRLIGVAYTAYRLRVHPQSVAGTTRSYRPWQKVVSSVVRRASEVRFPWRLPYDAVRDEANAWIAHLGATRSEVMQAMSVAPWNDLDLACEYLNVSPAERRIFNSAPAADYEEWGFAASTDQTAFDPIAGDLRGPGIWHELLKNVSLLRSRARLTHRELLNVLETRFVRAGAARLEIAGEECDTALMWLEGMNPAIARRIHIFVRLWRKLGWSTVELDRAVIAYGIGTVVSGHDVFTDSFLRFVANIARLRASSSLSILQLLDLFGQPSASVLLDTAEYWDHSGVRPQRILSRYQQWFDNNTLGKSHVPEFQLNLNRIELVTVGRPKDLDLGLPRPRISDHLTYIAAVLAVPESELAELLPASSICIPPQKTGGLPGRPIEVQGSTLKEIEIVLGAMSEGAVFSLTVQASDSETEASFQGVAATDLQGGISPLSIDAETQKLTSLIYTGSRKYLRCVISPTSGTNPSLWIRVRVLTKQGIVHDDLTRANLTALCRYALLRRIIGVPVKELLKLMAFLGVNSLSGIDGPEKVLGLLDARRSLDTLSLSISQADELLYGPSGDHESELDVRAEALLTTTREENQKIRSESTVSDDKRSGLLKNVLTGLGWDERLIADVLGAEGLGCNFGRYEAPLEAMPTPMPIALPASITFSSTSKRLIASRSSPPVSLRAEVDLLLADPLLGGSQYDHLRTALGVIRLEASGRVGFLLKVQKWMRAKKLPTHRADLATEPALKFELPAEWKGRIYYDQSNRKLCLTGWITTTDVGTLKSFEISPPANSSFANAIDELHIASRDYHADAENKLVAPGGNLTIENLLLDTDGLEARCGLVLEHLLPDWRRQKLHAKLSSTLSQALGSNSETAEALLALPCSAESQSFESLLFDPQLLASNPASKLSRTGFPISFDAALRLLTLGQLLSQLKMDAAQVSWLGGTWSGLDLTGLPTQRWSSATAGNWSTLQALSSLIALRDHPAVSVSRLQEIIALTPIAAPSIEYAPLAVALGCSEDTLRSFASAEGLNISAPAWFHVPSQLLRLVRCLELADQMHMPANLFVGIKRAQLMSRTTAEAAVEAEAEVRALRQMALGKSTSSAWMDDERKVLDGIRQRRRDATVEYLVQEHGVLDANDLYGHYLIDPQMNPCMMTSRIKQAISSVQLFIQRCLMNLEPDAPARMIEVKSWEKYYRMWEANRKVLLYPENWIEPELRDDKTPFFDDVVSSLQQGDATSDKAQLAVQGFLEKLTDLSRVDVVATCSSYDDEGYLLATHIFARTFAEPHTYWHRQFIKQDTKNPTSSLGIWTAWQPVDLDIEGDHLFPFVWQGRLFLFWAIFSQEAKEPTAAELLANQGEPPEKHWQLKFAWSEFKSGKWCSRKISSSKLITTDIPIRILPEALHFLATPREAATIIRFYSGEFLISVLHFDGSNMRISSGEIPMDEDPPYPEECYVNMKFEVQRNGPVQLTPTKMLNTSYEPRIKTQDSSIRSTHLLYPPNQLWAVFSAPSAWAIYLHGIPAGVRTTPFIQSDWVHRFFVYPTWATKYDLSFISGEISGVRVAEIPFLHYHALDWPQANRLRKTFSSSGLDKLLSYDSQVEKPGGGILGYFENEYSPSPEVISSHPDGDLEFSALSATSQYNWELFFHAPFSIACSLSKNQRFEEARKWFHYIFDPTDNSVDTSPSRYWRFRPFREAGQGLRIDELVRLLTDSGNLTQKQREEKSAFETLIAMWKDQPFQPHLVARMRIRSYMYTVVMKYLDNLIAWGDQLFRRETLEALNEATQLYILAAQILGRRPEGIPRRTRPVVKSFSELFSSQRDNLDNLSNALVEAENLVPSTSTAGSTQASGNLKSLYFCVPNNPKLLEYYDRVEDRLFKLRNCMNIDGVVRHLPLFEPAIDPSMLVRAAAAGVDVSAVLADLNAPLPFYRFNVMAQKATELCSEVKGLGAALLSAIEKGDAEAMALMRSGHELQMLQSVRMVKELQLHEAKANMDAIGVSLESAQKRFTHYIALVSQLEALSIPTTPVGVTIQSLALAAIEPLTTAANFVQSSASTVNPIMADSMEKIKQTLARTAEALSATLPPESSATDKVPMNTAEKMQLNELKSAHDLQKKAMDQRLVAQVLAKIPDFTLGAQGFSSSPVVQLTLGGTLLSSFANFSASILDTEASEHSYRAGLHSTLAGYQRRAADWLLQAELAAKDIEQITMQIAASNLRIAIASQELRNHDLQAENARSVDEFMHSKYSNRELYNWMSGQLSNLHFQAYQLAYDVAKRAERCFKHELGVDSIYIKFGYWDNLKKGLLAGENLHSDIKRMEIAYLNQNARELEITKHVSLRQLNPMALIQLRESGECEFEVPEALFDMDFPGHYFRRIKSVSISVPCVVGPYASVSGTLTLLSSKLREKSVVSGGYLEETNYCNSYLPIQSISTSTGQNDSGLFELNFRDERYLPFEGGGAISNWRFKLPEEFRAFDYNSISDVILHIRYTARDGGEPLAISAKAAARSQLNALHQLSSTEYGLVQVLSLRHEYPTEWSQLQSGTDGATRITLDKARFPYLVSGENVSLVHFGALARVRTPVPIRDAQGVFCLKLTKGNGNSASTAILGFPDRPNLGNWRKYDQGGTIQNGSVTVSTISEDAQWELKLLSSAQPTAVIDKQHRALLEDIVLLVGYRI